MDRDGGPRPHGILLLVDQDDSLISGLVAGAYTRGELGEILTVEKVSLDEGNERIDSGDGSGLLVIPAGFGDAFFDATPVTLTLKTNPSQTILPGIIRDVTEILLDAGFYTQRMFGEELAKLNAGAADSAPDAEFAASIARTVQAKLEAAAPYLFPPQFTLEIGEPPEEKPSVSFALLFLPGIILMGMMFSASGLAADYWIERELGTLRRMVAGPGRLLGFVAAKTLAAGLVVALIGGLAMGAGFLYHGIGAERLLPSSLWIGLSGLALFAWFSVLQMIGPTQRASNLIATMLLLPLLMVGGSFFPIAALPDWLAAIGRRTPNGFVADRLTTEITGSIAWSIDVHSWLAMLVATASGIAICAWRLKSGFARG
jgi:ABC-2 type transport system permease protein